ncbi:MAG TPA: lanthionine synthetase LanC family protein [Kofleriaceae bacterium]
MRPDRRLVLAGISGAVLAACTRGRPRAHLDRPAAAAADYLEHARAAARFLRALAVETPHGLSWRKSPDEPGSTDLGLYHGSAGPVVFFLELHRATGERAALDQAIAGAAHIAATSPREPGITEIGLYGGPAGHTAVFTALAADAPDPRIAGWIDDAIARLEHAAAPTSGGGVAYPAVDMMFGNAGVIVALLPLAGPRARALAIALGDGLLACAQDAPPGRRWLSMPGDTAEYPNFSHGTAGIAFALARLYEVTRDGRYLDAALAGARHLLSLAHTDGDVCLIPHRIPDGTERYYLGYCHGPAGTARLFHQLHHVTGDPAWASWFRRSVNGILYSGIPEARTPGFWDNVGQCCGSAAVAELLLSLHRLTDDPGYAELAHTLAADLLRRATRRADGGLEWIHAENRADPFWRQSYTGYMQGAAGIGSLLLRLAAHDRRLAWKVRLPDNPLPIV